MWRISLYNTMKVENLRVENRLAELYPWISFESELEAAVKRCCAVIESSLALSIGSLQFQ